MYEHEYRINWWQICGKVWSSFFPLYDLDIVANNAVGSMRSNYLQCFFNKKYTNFLSMIYCKSKICWPKTVNWIFSIIMITIVTFIRSAILHSYCKLLLSYVFNMLFDMSIFSQSQYESLNQDAEKYHTYTDLKQSR
jgi:hypothetical protein